ncbi:MAG: hypothetical protein ACI87L_001534, partial [Litorivivens sp.]
MGDPWHSKLVLMGGLWVLHRCNEINFLALFPLRWHRSSGAIATTSERRLARGSESWSPMFNFGETLNEKIPDCPGCSGR